MRRPKPRRSRFPHTHLTAEKNQMTSSAESLPVAVLMQRLAAPNRWEDWQFKLLEVMPATMRQMLLGSRWLKTTANSRAGCTVVLACSCLLMNVRVIF